MAPAAQRMREEFAGIVRDMIRPLSLGFGLFIGYTAVKGWVTIADARDRLYIAGADTMVALYLLGLAAWVWFRPPPARTMNAWGASIAFALAGTDMVTMSVRGEIGSFPAFALVLAGLGLVVLSWRYLLVSYAVLWGAWLTLTNLFASNPGASSFLLQITTITGLALHWGRLRAYTQLITAREKEAEARHSLELLNEELEQFASVVAHDLKTPLTAIRLKTRALRARSDDGQVAASVRDLDRIARSMNGLIEDLLAYARSGGAIAAGEDAELRQVCLEVVATFEPMMEEAGGTIEVGPLPHFIGDRTLLMQLVQNLVSNAILYHREESPHVTISGEETGGRVSFSVVDNGAGFDVGEVSQLFEPFRRGEHHKPGHGLGLATCARIVERFGGTIDVESTPGQGSTFTVTLPRKEEGEKVANGPMPLLQPS